MCLFRVRLSKRVSVEVVCHVYGIIRTFQCVLCSSVFFLIRLFKFVALFSLVSVVFECSSANFIDALYRCNRMCQ